MATDLAPGSPPPSAPALFYHHTDMLGSVRATTDATGTTVVRHDYGPWGTSSPTPGDPRRFTGLERDPETAFDYASARYYRSAWGRFTSADDSAFMDLADPQSFNLYSYVLNNPLRWVDPTGHDAQCPTNECVTVKPEQPIFADLDKTAFEWGADMYRDYLVRLVQSMLYLLQTMNDVPGKASQAFADEVISIGRDTFFFQSTEQFARGLEGVTGLQAMAIGGGPARGFKLLGSGVSKAAKSAASLRAMDELLSGGGRRILPRTGEVLKYSGVLVERYGGRAEDWIKITSTNKEGLQIHAYKSLATNAVVELKSIIGVKW